MLRSVLGRTVLYYQYTVTLDAKVSAEQIKEPPFVLTALYTRLIYCHEGANHLLLHIEADSSTV